MTGKGGWPVSTRGSLVSILPVLGIQLHTGLFGEVAGDLNSGLHSCATGALWTTIYPAPALFSVRVMWAGNLHEVNTELLILLLFLPSAGIINTYYTHMCKTR